MAAPDKLADVAYVIFDMDGLLNGMLSRHGYRMTWAIKQGTMGRSQRAATEYIYSQCPGLAERFPIDDYLVELNATYSRVMPTVEPMAGAVDLVERLHAAGVPIALATGSGQRMYEAKTTHLPEIFGRFPPDCIVTADSPDVGAGRSKPFPDVFLAAARRLGRDVGTPESCTSAQRAERARGLVFEDAPLGVQAALAAGMNVVWIPHPELRALHPDETHGATQTLRALDEWQPGQYGVAL